MKKYYDRLMSYLPVYEKNSSVFSEMMKTIALELCRVSDGIDDFVKQLFIDTATWGLDCWEHNAGLDISTADYDFRRRRLKARLKRHEHLSDLMVAGVVKSWTGGDDVYVEFLDNGVILIDISTKNIHNTHLKHILYELDTIKPAFYMYDFNITIDGSYIVFSNILNSHNTTHIFPKQTTDICEDTSLLVGSGVVNKNIAVIYPLQTADIKIQNSKMFGAGMLVDTETVIVPYNKIEKELLKNE